MPIPHRLQGRVRVHPQGLFNFSTPLDASGRHRWGPLAPQARVEVELQHPGQTWSGHGYLDSNVTSNYGSQATSFQAVL